ncbi:2-iminobutanoate/2-iminopropanoate deaminase [Orbus hercynius]|uniref:2-iminobutanoate/2-iminopropanoate deaminase n=1 Tax=Orbus hercynius TaxID=593135 RepID=A0A495RDW2_9GAMM|nr:RidA family protein [Orbus hercynius]RKS85128.1 2-iminobutanoate/2-iminopropanoate deaminase [Orbus hercynius]
MVKIINSDKAPAAIGPYVQAVDLGNLVFVSGQLPLDPATGTMSDDVSTQAKQSLANIKAILAAANCQVGNIVKTTIFLADMNDFAAVNAAYDQFFKDHNASFPARSCVQVARIPKDAKVEIEVIANR